MTLNLRRSFFCVAVAIFTFVEGYSQQSVWDVFSLNPYTTKDYQLQGPVKSVWDSTAANRKGYSTPVIQHNLKFNKQGLLVESPFGHIKYFYQGDTLVEIRGGRFTVRRLFSYPNDSTIEVAGFDTFDQQFSGTTYIYRNGWLIRVDEHYTPRFGTLDTVDVITNIHFRKKDGLFIESRITNDTLTSEIQSYYDSTQLIHRVVYFGDKQIHEFSEFDFNNRGELSCYFIIDEQDEKYAAYGNTYKEEYEYLERDDFGNWKVRKVYFLDELIRTEYRKFTYYRN